VDLLAKLGARDSPFSRATRTITYGNGRFTYRQLAAVTLLLRCFVDTIAVDGKEANIMMMLANTSRWRCVLVVVSALSFVAACGDYKVTTRGWDPSAKPGSLWNLDGCVVELARLSSRCNEATSDPLSARVGSSLEFPGEMVAQLESPCADGPEVQVDIDLEGQSVLYDFSNVAAAGRFPSAEFEGFVITDTYHSVAAIVGASFDGTLSTLSLPEEALSFEAHSISVNLEGIAFDQTSFIKVDLVLERNPT